MAELKIRAAAKMMPIEEGVDVKDHSIQTRDGASIACRVYKPNTPRAPFPGLLYIHGGGWTLGDLDGEDGTCRWMCTQAEVVVVSVDYRLAPEHPFPAGFNDAYDSLRWAAAVVLQAREDGIELRGQILRTPVTCHMDCYPPELNLSSMEDNKDAPLLSKTSMQLFWSYYNPPVKTDWRVSPLLASSFKALPKTYIQIAGLDPLRDEGLAYAIKLKAAGVDVKLDAYPGVPHAFGYFPSLRASQKNANDLINAIHWMTRELV
ncbi:hypothetical protein RBB50_012828 [Rhinocladiella similis]